MIAALVLAAGFAIPPTPDHYVTDNAGALSSSARSSIENELKAYEKDTGHQIVVWIGQTTAGVPLETYTGETADHWKVGRKGHDDGAVLFVFMRDRKIRIEVGYGLESRLTDAESHRIIADDITPKMRAGDADAAITSGVADMLTTAEPSYKLTELQQARRPPADSDEDANRIGVGIFAGLFIVIGLVFFFILIMQIVALIRYGYLIVREGPSAAKKDMARSRFFSTTGFVSSSGSFGGGGFGGGFSAGGGSFGGGGASGGW